MSLVRSHIPAANADTVHRLARDLGFALLGIASVEPSAHAGYLRQWLAAGRHGRMDYLLDQVEERLDPQRLVPGARAAICVADAHAAAPAAVGESDSTTPPDNRLTGRIARYAWGRDYHRVIKKRLHRLADDLRERFPKHTFRSCVDTAPVLERELAVRAGLGWVGRNTMLIHPRMGSYLLLGEIITTLPLRTAADAGAVVNDHCGTCRQCLDACPTQCLSPYRIDASRCISYLTIEHPGEIDEKLYEAMGDWIAGCDVCQEVCPFNAPHESVQNSELASQSSESDLQDSGAPPGSAAAQNVRPVDPPPDATPGRPLPRNRFALPDPRSAYQPRPPAPMADLLEVLGWTAADRRRTLVNSALKRIKLDQFKRNALIALGHHLSRRPHPAVTDRLRALAEDVHESALVRATAGAVLRRLGF